jgi:hypothetical protein
MALRARWPFLFITSSLSKSRDSTRVIKEFDIEIKEEEVRAAPETVKLLTEKKQSLVSIV